MNSVDEVFSLNKDITGCDPITDSPLDILAGGVYSVRDHIVPHVGPTTPFDDRLVRLGLRVGNVWLTFNDLIDVTTRGDVRMGYFPGQDNVHIWGEALGRIHTGECIVDSSLSLLDIDMFTIEINITDGIIPILNAGADLASFIVRGGVSGSAKGYVYKSDCVDKFADSCPHFNFTLSELTGLTVLPDIMPVVETFTGGNPEATPSMIMGIDFPNVFPGTHSGLISFKVDNCDTEDPNLLLYQACQPFFHPETELCTGSGIVMFDVQSICNGCDPAPPTPGICPHHGEDHLNSASQSQPYIPDRRVDEIREAHVKVEKPQEPAQPVVARIADTGSDAKTEPKEKNGNFLVLVLSVLAVTIFCGVAFLIMNPNKRLQKPKKLKPSGQENAHQSDYPVTDNEHPESKDADEFIDL